MGRGCIEETLRHAPDRITSLLAADLKDRGDERRGAIVALARSSDVNVSFHPFDELTSIARSEAHQGFVARVRDERNHSLDSLIEASKDQASSLVILLDGISDPQNLGAILRAAECFGADGVVWSSNRNVSVTPAVSKSSVGATELLKWVEVSNLATAVRKLKSEGYWIVSAMCGEASVSLPSFVIPEKAAIVLGSEGSGISRLVRDISDFYVEIPLFGKLTSLNVSQAASVLLYAARTKTP